MGFMERKRCYTHMSVATRESRRYEYLNGIYQQPAKIGSAASVLESQNFVQLPQNGMAFTSYQQTTNRYYFPYAILVNLPALEVLIFCQDLKAYLRWCREYGCALSVLDQVLPDR
jgi:hypothetical protein